MRVTHLAGAVVRYRDRVIQRCAMCGEKLIDNLRQAGSAAVVSEIHEDKHAVEMIGDTTLSTLTWREACLVQVEGSRQLDIGLYTEVDSVPDDFCIALVE